MLEEEAVKRAELEEFHLQQQRAIAETKAEKQELERERLIKENALQAAMKQLDQLEEDRQGALEQYQVREMWITLWLSRKLQEIADRKQVMSSSSPPISYLFGEQ